MTGWPLEHAGLGVSPQRIFVEVDRYAIAWSRPGYSMGLILEAKGVERSL